MIEKIKFLISPSGISYGLTLFNRWLYDKFSFLGDSNLISASIFSVYFFIASLLFGYVMSGRIFFIFKTVWLYLLWIVYLGIYIATKYYNGNYFVYFLCLVVFLNVTIMIKTRIDEKLIQDNINVIADRILKENNKNNKKSKEKI